MLDYCITDYLLTYLLMLEALAALVICLNKKHLKNVGPIRHCEPPHAHSPDVASGTVARRLRIVDHDGNDKDDNDNA